MLCKGMLCVTGSFLWQREKELTHKKSDWKRSLFSDSVCKTYVFNESEEQQQQQQQHQPKKLSSYILSNPSRALPCVCVCAYGADVLFLFVITITATANKFTTIKNDAHTIHSKLVEHILAKVSKREGKKKKKTTRKIRPKNDLNTWEKNSSTKIFILKKFDGLPFHENPNGMKWNKLYCIDFLFLFSYIAYLELCW